MRILQMNPIEVKSFGGYCRREWADSILVGKCYANTDSKIFANITFPKILLHKNEILRKATLKMYCKSTCGPQDRMSICIDDDNACLEVCNIGSHEWDVTSSIICAHNVEYNFCIYTKDRIKRCGLKEFESLDTNTRPVLTVFIDEVTPDPHHGVVNIVKEYHSTQTLKHSDWIDCIALSEYYYFIENTGNEPVEVFIEISPDKNMVFTDFGPVVIMPHQTSYLLPMRVSHFVRISFRNMTGSGSNLLKTWFQGK